MSWLRVSQMFLCLYYQEKAFISCSHILPARPVSREYILFYYEGRKLQCYCRNIDINGCRGVRLLFQVLATSSAVMISENEGHKATETNGERAKRNKHPDGSCWNSELFLMYGPITQPFLFSLTLCNYFSQTGNTNHAETEWLSLNNHNGQLGGHTFCTIQLISRSSSQLGASIRRGGGICGSDHCPGSSRGSQIFVIFNCLLYFFLAGSLAPRNTNTWPGSFVKTPGPGPVPGVFLA